MRWADIADKLDGKVDPRTLSPSGLAEGCSRGQWQMQPHIEVIEDACLRAIEDEAGVMLSVAVRHGKSSYASQWLVAWYLGTNPDKRVILATHEATFARTWGRKVRDILEESGPEVFGIRPARGNKRADEWGIEGHEGGMLTVGVGGSPIGRGGDLILVDDPFKSWEDGMSALSRRRVLEWWTGTMESRREPGGATIIICARWHEDDLTGSLLRENPHEWHEVRLPAIADSPDDPMGREIGEALWPQRYSADELEKRRVAVSVSLGSQVWDAQYQQRPSSQAGDIFTRDWPIVEPYALTQAVRFVRGWDLAATQGGGDWTVGVLMAQLEDGSFCVVDVTAGQWRPDKVRAALRRCAADDPHGTTIVLPQDPGQAGKDQAEQLTRLLAGYDVKTLPQTGSKVIRSAGLAAQHRAGNISLLHGDWTMAFIDELAVFDRGRHDDQVDAAATAFNELAGSPAEALVGQYRGGRSR